MLKITIAGQQLELPEDFVLNLVYENPLFLNDRIPVPYSVSAALPPTPSNLRVLNYPDRLHNTTKFKEFSNCVITFNGINFLKGTFVVTSFDSKIKFHFKSNPISDKIKSPCNEVALQSYYLGNSFAVDADFYDEDNYAYACRELIEDSLAGLDDFVCAPIRHSDYFPAFEIADNAINPQSFFFDGIDHMFRLYSNFYDPVNKNFLKRAYPSPDGDYHSPTYPLTFLRHFIDSVFGSDLDNNLFDTGGLSRLVLFNPYNIDFLNLSWIYTSRGLITFGLFEKSLSLSRFFPYTPANDFVKEVFKTFGITLFHTGDSYQMKFNNDVVQESVDADWSNLLIGDLEIYPKVSQDYLYGYDGMEEQEGTGAYEYTVNTIKELENFALPVDPNGDEVTSDIYVSSTNQLIRKRKIADFGFDVDFYEYEVVDTGYGGVVSDSNEGLNVKSSLRPLPNCIYHYWDQITAQQNRVFNTWYVPYFDGDRFTSHELPYLGIYWGVKDTLNETVNGDSGLLDSYPYVSDKNYDAFGNRLGDISLAWDGDDGLITYYHQEFKEFIEAEKENPRGFFLLDALTLRNLDMSKKKHLKGKNFFVEKLEVSIRKNKIDPARISFIEAVEVDN